MELWHNATTGPGKAFWDKTAADFQTANPNVTIKVQSIQNEDLDGKLQTALNSGSAPDIFLQRGGGKMAAMVEAGQLKDITDDITDETRQAVGDAALKTGQVDGKAYAVPISILPGGLWYSKDLFQKAGVDGAADDAGRAQRRGDQAQGQRHADRPRRQGCVAGRSLVLLLRSARVQPGHARRRGQEQDLRRPLLDEGR